MRPGLLYVLAVFGVGFLLGPIRELVLRPRIGEFAATLTELPLMLGFAWIVAGWLVRRFAVPSGAPRWRMGGVALAALLALEFGLGTALRGWSLGEWLAHFLAPTGLLTLAGYVLFASWPRLQRQP